MKHNYVEVWMNVDLDDEPLCTFAIFPLKSKNYHVDKGCNSVTISSIKSLSSK